jgi:hypothetical protein
MLLDLTQWGWVRLIVGIIVVLVLITMGALVIWRLSCMAASSKPDQGEP